MGADGRTSGNQAPRKSCNDNPGFGSRSVLVRKGQLALKKKTLMKSNQNDELAEQLLDTKKSERPKEHVLKTPKKPTAEEKNKAAKQRKDIQNDLGK